MEGTVFLLFLCAAVEGDIGRHIFVPTRMTWLNAQTYCRETYTDLSFVSSASDEQRLHEAAGNHSLFGWIGLYREPSDITGWKWSGWGNLTYQNWSTGEPNNYNQSETVGHLWVDGRWNDINAGYSIPFYCIDFPVVKVKKSWEEALDHCREQHRNLTSLLSETQHLEAQRWIQDGPITEPVWIGLRYLGDRWLWENGDLLVYEAWPQGGDQDHQCPLRKRCGALTQEGLWENLDCQDQLHFICA